jgi:membrane protease YdiL (CAAX protease family)
VSGFLRALVIAMAVPMLNHIFMGFAGFLQLRSTSVSWAEAVHAAVEAPLNYALVQAASVGVIFIFAFPHRARSESFLDAVRVRPLVGSIASLCFIAGMLLQLPLAEVGNLVQELWPISFDEVARRHRLVHPTTWSGGVSVLLAIVLVAPVTEELLFRGWLLQDLKAQYGTAPALLLSSVLFGLVHLEASAMIYATLAGLVLGSVALRTRSTLGSIAMHAGVNALPILLPTTLVRIEGFNTLDQSVEHISPWLLLLSLGGAGTALAIIWQWTATEPADG